jgi:hypothetical protein
VISFPQVSSPKPSIRLFFPHTRYIPAHLILGVKLRKKKENEGTNGQVYTVPWVIISIKYILSFGWFYFSVCYISDTLKGHPQQCYSNWGYLASSGWFLFKTVYEGNFKIQSYLHTISLSVGMTAQFL